MWLILLLNEIVKTNVLISFLNLDLADVWANQPPREQQVNCENQVMFLSLFFRVYLCHRGQKLNSESLIVDPECNTNK